MQRPDPSRPRPLILIVDDCIEQRDLYEVVLELDFEIVTASRGSEAIAIALARHPDAIVLDVRMPGMSGLEVCEHLKSHPSTAAIPVIMLTGDDDPDLAHDGMDAGAAAVLTKPCTPVRLQQAILAARDKV